MLFLIARGLFSAEKSERNVVVLEIFAALLGLVPRLARSRRGGRIVPAVVPAAAISAALLVAGADKLEAFENHEKLAEGLYRTTYSNGVAIYVNYNKYDITAENGVTVPARDYVAERGEW